jgi:DNA mismatch endonuclease, patch repair protein
MADVVDRAVRSRMMSGIRATDTEPERFLRKGLHARGFRFRIHDPKLPGKPDIVLPKFHAVIAVNGCFWHGHGCRFCKMPVSNATFWAEKLQKNVRRDERNLSLLLESGWRCLVVWECAVRRARKEQSPFDLVGLTASWLISSGVAAEINEDGLTENELALVRTTGVQRS